MCVFAEQRALLLRLALGVWGIGGPGSVKRLLAWLGGLVEIERTGKGKGSCVRREDGGLKILLPHHLAEGWETAHCLLHELGHGLTTTTEWRPEGEAEDAAEDFRLAWILPRELVRGACRDSSAAVAQLAYSAGVGSDVICERVDWHLLHTPPRSHHRSSLVRVRAFPAADPLYQQPQADCSYRQTRRMVRVAVSVTGRFRHTVA